jgi:hypothetical protein
MTFTSTTIRKLRALNLEETIFEKVLEIFEEAKEAKPKKKGGAADRKERGTRLQPDWVLPDDWRQYSLGIGLRGNEVVRESEKFRNYWTSQAGARGIKLDWRGTWRNWCISVLERAGRPILTPPENGGGPDGGAAQEGPRTFTDATWNAIMVRYTNGAQWNPSWGPEPGRRGCLVPDKYSLFPPSVDYEMGP